MQDLVSVIIPAFNSAHLVSDAVASALTQTYRDVEAIVVDDGSTDDTHDVVQTLMKNDARVRYVHQPNKGLGGARNTGIAQARGEFIAFLDADDIFLPGKTAVQIDALHAQPEVGMVVGGYQFADAKTGALLGERRPWQHNPNLDLGIWLIGCPAITCSVLVRKAWLDRVGGFAPLPRVEDKDLWIRLSHAGCRMAWTPHIVSAYRIHPDQMTRDGRAQKEFTLQVLEKFFAQADLPEAIRAKREQAFASAYLEGAFREYCAGQFESACASFAEAIRRDDTLLRPADSAHGLPPILFTMISWAISPNAQGVAGFNAAFFAHLPSEAHSLSNYKQQTLVTAVIAAAVDACSVNNTALASRHLAEAVESDAQVAQHGDDACQTLIDFVRELPNAVQVACVEHFFESVPKSLQSWEPLRAKVLGKLKVSQGFEAHRRGQWREAAKAMWNGMRLSPSWATNRGVLSVLVKGLTHREEAARK